MEKKDKEHIKQLERELQNLREVQDKYKKAKEDLAKYKEQYRNE
jgi:hypothetical protein